MAFVSDTILRVILSNGLDCLYDVSKGSDEVVDELLSYTKVDNEPSRSVVEQIKYNFDEAKLPRSAILARLIRAN